MTSLSERGYGIPMLPTNDTLIKEIEKELTVTPNNFSFMGNNDSDNSFQVFQKSPKKIYMPKFYGLSKYGEPEIRKITEGLDMHSNVSFQGSLRENQLKPVEDFLNTAKNPLKMGGILQLPPGWGKTVMALYISVQLFKKTLVVVHKDFLLKQWKERIEQYIPSAKIGIIKQAVNTSNGCDIVIASLQTLLSRNFSDNSFGLVIVDECHHMGAQVFCKALHRMNYQYSLGLSATVQRADGMSKVFKWFLGDIVFKAQRDKDPKSLKVQLVRFQDDSPVYCREVRLYNGQVNMAKMLNNICEYLPRTRHMVKVLNEVLKEEPGRNVIILSDRRNHLTQIYNIMMQTGFDGDNMGFYVGGMKQEALIESESKQILLGTYNMVSEGFDLPKLDTLVMASPKSNVEQSVGRIQRKAACDIENTPLVIDVIDNFSVFKNQSKKRNAFYKSRGFKVDTFGGDDVAKPGSSSASSSSTKLFGKPLFIT